MNSDFFNHNFLKQDIFSKLQVIVQRTEHVLGEKNIFKKTNKLDSLPYILNAMKIQVSLHSIKYFPEYMNL